MSSLQGTYPRATNNDILFGKLNFVINARNSLSASYDYANNTAPNGYTTSPTSNNDSIQTNGSYIYHERIFIANLDSVASNTMVNNARFQWGRDLETAGSNAPGPYVSLTNITNYGADHPLYLDHPHPQKAVRASAGRIVAGHPEDGIPRRRRIVLRTTNTTYYNTMLENGVFQQTFNCTPTTCLALAFPNGIFTPPGPAPAAPFAGDVAPQVIAFNPPFMAPTATSSLIFGPRQVQISGRLTF